MKFSLNRDYLEELPPFVIQPSTDHGKASSVLHFGVGSFHRSHQALYFQKLLDLNSKKFQEWSIVGACILPQDEAFVQKMKQQDFLYTLKSSSSEGKDEVRVISSIKNLLFGPTDFEQIINTIGSDNTKIVSFTITEGGYLIDEESGRLQIDHPEIIFDLKGEGIPKTVFGYLARGLALRRENQASNITLLSCDNVQENGQVLKKALLSFLSSYDKDLKQYVKRHVSFPNSMVDRITPSTTIKEIENFEKEYGYRDECLVVSEDFCQWVIEETEETIFSALQVIGVNIVKDVKPYEKMKLRILNGGHSLVGLFGKALGYEYINTAIRDTLISELFDLYIKEETISSLNAIQGQSFTDYMRKVKSRFGNELIQDSTDRIISFSSAKIPKFVLPVLEYSLNANRPFQISTLIIAAWWHYLNDRVNINEASEIKDNIKKGRWVNIFNLTSEKSVIAFLETKEVFGNLGRSKKVQEQVMNKVLSIESKGITKTMEDVLDTYK